LALAGETMSSVSSDDSTFSPWQAPDVEHQSTQVAPASPSSGLLTAGNLEDLQKEAYREAYAQGLKEGIAQGQERLKVQVERFAALMNDLARPFEQADDQVEKELVMLAVALARQIVRRELKSDPTQVIAIIREAIKALPVASRDVRVMLHPEDAAIVRQHLAPTASERAWTTVEDPVMARGGCQVVSATSRVDARLESRLNTILAELVGEEMAVAEERKEDRI
jgi:flagellar assembly protein FliH